MLSGRQPVSPVATALFAEALSAESIVILIEVCLVGEVLLEAELLVLDLDLALCQYRLGIFQRLSVFLLVSA